MDPAPGSPTLKHVDARSAAFEESGVLSRPPPPPEESPSVSHLGFFLLRDVSLRDADLSTHLRMSPTNKALSGTAFSILLMIAFMMGANHVAARTAFNHGLDVVTAVSVRSVITASVVALILWHQ